MWSRAELKRRGKVAFKSNYGRSVLAAFILSLAVGGISINTVSLSDEQMDFLLETMNPSTILTVLRAAAGGLLLSIIITLFLLAPLSVGCRRFFISNSERPEKLGTCLYGFRHNYWNVVMVLFVEQIYLILWGILLVFPAIIKSYSYRMVPYILAEHPDMPANEVITKSRQMMNGHKWRTFILDLSFLGWTLLSLLTLGILTYLYVLPYMYSTDAELYRVLSGKRSAFGGTDRSFGGNGAGGSGGYGQGGPGGYDEGGLYDEPDPHDDPYNGYY